MKIDDLMHSKFEKILGAFAKLRIVSITFVMSVYPSVRPTVFLTVWNNSAPTGLIFINFDILLFFEHFSKNNVLLILHGDQQTFYSHLAQFFFESENFRTKFVGKLKNLFYIQNRFFENRTFYEKTWKKFCRAGQGADDKVAHALCMLDT
jgi:hypothetical protein